MFRESNDFFEYRVYLDNQIKVTVILFLFFYNIFFIYVLLLLLLLLLFPASNLLTNSIENLGYPCLENQMIFSGIEWIISNI